MFFEIFATELIFNQGTHLNKYNTKVLINSKHVISLDQREGWIVVSNGAVYKVREDSISKIANMLKREGRSVTP